MKKLLQKRILFLVALYFGSISINTVFCQTDGTLTFTVNLTAKSGSYGSDHYVAVWIENNGNTFVKTKVKYADSHATGSHNHLPQWKAATPSLNIVDATTGPSLSTYTTPITFTWNAKDISNNIVTDGTYKVRVEYTWGSSTSTSNTTFTFNKGPVAEHLTPANEPNFTNIVLDWVPVSSSVTDILLEKNVNIFPNPTTHILNLEFNKKYSNCTISIENAKGQTVYSEKNSQMDVGNKSINISKLSKGIYFVKITTNNESANFRVVIE